MGCKDGRNHCSLLGLWANLLIRVSKGKTTENKVHFLFSKQITITIHFLTSSHFIFHLVPEFRGLKCGRCLALPSIFSSIDSYRRSSNQSTPIKPITINSEYFNFLIANFKMNLKKITKVLLDFNSKISKKKVDFQFKVSVLFFEINIQLLLFGHTDRFLKLCKGEWKRIFYFFTLKKSKQELF